MNIVIRTDASFKIGSGHVMRCLTIATELRKKGHEVFFWMKELPGDMRVFVQSKGFVVITEMTKADICIIDHYDIDREWERKIRPFVKKIVVIDDLANRIHDCDLLLDQNVVPNYEHRYDDLVPAHCVKLLGPRYLIMREEFIRERKSLPNKMGGVNRILIFMGGSDPTSETLKVLTALTQHQIFQCVDVVVGNSNPHKTKIKDICMKEGYLFHCQIDYLASLMAKADFSIGAGGSATWERCFVGLPSSSSIVAENQRISTETAEELGVIWNLGWHEQVTADTYKDLLWSLKGKKELLINMRNAGLKLTEQSGGARSWLDAILEVTE
ncbi:UDP-2,4-diacetamido-2,4,6-trideoxy-beta-L-altropyranose hydrolase [Lysinibacillus parviboronicapiens]|uniref:UDP-2,4-diacetamido-2,4, 6-trideoxy-beta-L-altropyranose hydrolase n=1 Tax=Lysinibacillus parviboronicapiens TaxID=436516 RepID=A0ABV2PIU7_9BACI